VIENDRRRWRALRNWFDDFPPGDQERLLGYLERLMISSQDQDMGAFMDWIDQLFLLLDRLEAESGQGQTQRDTQAT
jgi:hypothetical protein